MNVLITGAGGFIGSHLVDSLLRDGHCVTAVCRSRNDALECKEANKNYLNKLSVIVCDLRFESQVNRLPFTSVEWVFHLAAKTGNYSSKLDPLSYHTVNVDGTVNLLERSRKARIKKFVYVSTASVYGIPDIYPTPETSRIRLDYPYAVTKYIGEEYCLHYWKVYKLPVVVLRLFNVYGSKNRPSGDFGPTLSIFIDQKKKGLPLTIRGNGLQTRDFTNIDDVCDVFQKIATSPAAGEIFNIGSGVSYSMNDVATFIGGSVSYVPFIEKEPHMTLADVTKIRAYTGWKPNIALPDGIEKLV